MLCSQIIQLLELYGRINIAKMFSSANLTTDKPPVRQQSLDLIQRRQICSRIKELETECSTLKNKHEILSARLSELNTIADDLINGHQNTQPPSFSEPTEAFKVKLASCLNDMMPKANTIADLCDELSKKSSDNE